MIDLCAHTRGLTTHVAAACLPACQPSQVIPTSMNSSGWKGGELSFRSQSQQSSSPPHEHSCLPSSSSSSSPSPSPSPSLLSASQSQGSQLPRPLSTSTHAREWSTATMIRHTAQGSEGPRSFPAEVLRSFRPISSTGSGDLRAAMGGGVATMGSEEGAASVASAFAARASAARASAASTLVDVRKPSASSPAAIATVGSATDHGNNDDVEASTSVGAAGHLHISRRGSIHLTVPDPANEQYVRERLHLKRFADGSIVVDTVQDQQQQEEDSAEIRTSLRDRFASPRRGRGQLPKKGDSAALISPKMRLELERFKLAEHLRVAERKEVSRMLCDAMRCDLGLL